MATHGMAHNRLPIHIYRQMFGDQLWQFGFKIATHLIVFGERLLRRIDVKARAEPKVIGTFRVIGHPLPAWRGIWGNEDQAKLSAGGTIFALFGNIGVGASQPRQVPNDGQLLARLMIGYKGLKHHLGACRCGRMAINALLAAIGFDRRNDG